VKRFKTPGRQIRHTERRLHRRLHNLSLNRAVPLLDEEQSDERAAGTGAVCGDFRGNGARDGIIGGEKVKVSSIRGEYIAKAMVTKRIKAMTIDGKKVYQIGIPFIKAIVASRRTKARTRGRW